MAFSEASRTLLIAIAGLTLASGAHAATITTFNTGVNGSGTPLADGAIGDPHYLLTAVPSGSTTAIRVRTSVGGYPIGPWLADDTISAWIGPNNDAQVDGPVGNYDYRTTFNLTGFNPATASLMANGEQGNRSRTRWPVPSRRCSWE